MSERLPRHHRLKTWPEFFEPTREGLKPFEVRKNDRDFQVGDTLHLMEWSPKTEEYSGRTVDVLVTYMLEDAAGLGLMKGHVVMGIEPCYIDSPRKRLEDAKADGAQEVLLEAIELCRRVEQLASTDEKKLAVGMCMTLIHSLLPKPGACAPEEKVQQ